MKTTLIRLGLLFALMLAVTPWLLAAEEKVERQILQGKVTPLADLVKKLGSTLDSDAAPHWLALVTEDGKAYPLIKDAGSRMFFKDKRLLNRSVRLEGRVLPGSHLLQVITMRTLKEGKPHEVYYWCDICSIRRPELNLCECCGGPMEMVEVVEKK